VLVAPIPAQQRERSGEVLLEQQGRRLQLSYGSPQSLGCIELPYAAAEQAWGYLTYGTLVTVLS